MGLLGLTSNLPKGFGLFSLSQKENWIETLYSSSEDVGYAISVDSNGTIYAFGITLPGSVEYYYAAKLSNDGTLSWQKVDTVANSRPISSSIKGTNEIYTGGTFIDTGDSLKKLTTVKYDNSGSIQWQRKLSTTNYELYNEGICNDNTGNVINAGWYYNTVGDYESLGLLAKYNSSGTLQWQKALEDIDTYFYDVYSDSSDNLYVVGTFAKNVDFSDYTGLLVKYNSSGVVQWQRELGVSGNLAEAQNVVLDSSGNIYFSGRSDHNESYYNPIITKYNSSGTLQWQRKLSIAASCYSYGIDIDSNDNVYVIYHKNLAPTEILIFKYNSSGTLQWQRNITVGTGNLTPYEASVIGSNIYIIGQLGDGSLVDIVLFKFPIDGSKTGTYALNGYNYTYAATTFTESAASLTSGTPSLIESTPTFTDSTLGMSLTTATLSNAIVRF